MSEIKELAEAIHELAIEKGWWQTERSVPEVLCLIHSEVSECLEVWRQGDSLPLPTKGGFYEPVSEELADIVIRVFDAAEAWGIDIEQAILKKHEYNKSRPYRHEGKRA